MLTAIKHDKMLYNSNLKSVLGKPEIRKTLKKSGKKIKWNLFNDETHAWVYLVKYLFVFNLNMGKQEKIVVFFFLFFGRNGKSQKCTVNV